MQLKDLQQGETLTHTRLRHMDDTFNGCFVSVPVKLFACVAMPGEGVSIFTETGTLY